LAFISADEISTAWEELASSPSSSKISIAKENKLSGSLVPEKKIR